jgi:hypothetical protein
MSRLCVRRPVGCVACCLAPVWQCCDGNHDAAGDSVRTPDTGVSRTQMSYCAVRLAHLYFSFVPLPAFLSGYHRHSKRSLFCCLPADSFPPECSRAMRFLANPLQMELHDAQFAKGVKFSIKIGIGAGFINVLYVGGMYGRSEYVTTGEALTQAFKCEAECG